MKHGLIFQPHPRMPRLGAVLDTLPMPEKCDWHAAIEIDGDALGNDHRSNCVEAAAWRAVQIWRAVVAHDARRPTAELALNTYRRWAGWDGTDATDLGTETDRAAAFWGSEGLQWADQWTDLPSLFSVDVGDNTHIRKTIANFGPIQLDLALARAWDGETIWRLIDGANGVPGSGDRHRICCGKYDAQYLYGITWGFEVGITWDAVARHALGAEGAVTRSWLRETGLSPSGLDLTALERASRSLAA